MSTEIEKSESKSKAVVLTKEREQALINATAYGKRESTSIVIIGEQLKFVKSEWQRWEDGRVVDADMGAIVDWRNAEHSGSRGLAGRRERRS
jgi:hypothetical protein